MRICLTIAWLGFSLCTLAAEGLRPWLKSEEAVLEYERKGGGTVVSHFGYHGPYMVAGAAIGEPGGAAKMMVWTPDGDKIAKSPVAGSDEYYTVTCYLNEQHYAFFVIKKYARKE